MAASMTRCKLRILAKRLCDRQLLRLLSSTKSSGNDSAANDSTQRKTHFGFETVTEAEKEEKVYSVFKNVADKYDLMNDAMSVGVHRLWKDAFIRRLAPRPGTKLLDVAGGTGDIAFRFLKYANSLSESGGADFDVSIPRNVTANVYMDPAEDTSSNSDTSDDSELLGNRVPASHVTVCDINQSMLDVGMARALDAGIYSGMSWLQGNAECLPVEDNSYDAYTIAFGIRNCTHIDKVVEEAYRVLKPGGRFMCLEFSRVPNPVIRSVYDEYSFQVIPVMGQLLAADWKSYQYLVESIRQFPSQEDFKALIESCGFKAVTYENLTFGVVAIHSGFKL
ncbi:2-methoxy-6-polyprenyl-1,4-benzoquinol methylase, mitochondrial-like [Mercenaria mercenaria]|uniref:2-methoxy-6-polyprenyl-1,4-benzoquinol methylase, mitochondrial-like n=1 Tax=Mercenaria mercenaria TaxID=6596 RepID=UPI00234F55A4|nr:2-methoxy-6-polyprenyl-1,4-benzoquinol methylase, mitochondrial-like [Mercenaria mercenaria]